MFDLAVIDGMIYLDHKFEEINIYIKDQKIVTLSKKRLKAEKIISANGKYVLPGFIDPHVHFALGVGNNISKDDFYTGSKEALLGGVTTIIDFLDPIKKAEEVKEQFEKRMEIARDSLIDFGFHTTIANPSDRPDQIIEESKKLGIPSVKLFTTYSDTDRRTYDSYIYELLEECHKSQAMTLIHAENDELIWKKKQISVKDHERSRAAITENIEVFKLAEIAEKTGGKLYFVHISAGSSIDILEKNFSHLLKKEQIIIESCPHYFWFNTDVLNQGNGYLYTMTPPVRDEKERKKLETQIGLVNVIGTDHCPYTGEQKNHLYTSDIPMGVGGIRYSFLNMYEKFGFSILDRFTSKAASAHGITGKGKLLPGYDADIVIFNDQEKTVINDSSSIYHEQIRNGKIEDVFIKGNHIVKEGRVVEPLVKGKYIRRKI